MRCVCLENYRIASIDLGKLQCAECAAGQVRQFSAFCNDTTRYHVAGSRHTASVLVLDNRHVQDTPIKK